MTFWPAYKAMRSIAAGKNVAEKTPTKAPSADWGFSEPKPPTGGEAYTDLLGAVRPFTILLFYFYNYYKYTLLLSTKLFREYLNHLLSYLLSI
jgi:hypothetical protein